MKEARTSLHSGTSRRRGVDGPLLGSFPTFVVVLILVPLSCSWIGAAFAWRNLRGGNGGHERPAGMAFDITVDVSSRNRGVVNRAASFASVVSEKTSLSEEEKRGTKWALLIAGSSGYWNYRHQADICHAYQILSKNGMKDENIVVFMYDDIAHNVDNPRPGVLINSPHGQDVYKGVPKDYTGDNVRPEVFLAVLEGNKTAVKGIGSEKVVASGPEDHVFVFYSDHGAPGVVGMPGYADDLYADQINAVLEKKHKAGGFKELVFYLEACESGSIFEGLLKPEWEVYATTASNAEESSWATYCPSFDEPSPLEYDICLGDLYSVAWMEDSESRNLLQETLHDQFELVKQRTSQDGTYNVGSHVMQYGDVKTDSEMCAMYMGFDPAMVVDPKAEKLQQRDVLRLASDSPTQKQQQQQSGQTVPQRDADLVHFWAKYRNAPEGSERKAKALNELSLITAHRSHVDRSVGLIGSLVFGAQNSDYMMTAKRAPGLPLVDDWGCLRTATRTFESFCGPLRQYGLKHMRAFANMCNAHVSTKTLEKAASLACAGVALPTWPSS